MNRQAFLRELEDLLAGIPKNEREDALEYYQNYFEEAGAEKEQNVIRELGSPQKVAESIIEDCQKGNDTGYHANQQERSDASYTGENADSFAAMSRMNRISRMETWKKVLIVILLILSFPVWIGLAAGVFGGVIGFLGAIFGVLVAVLGSGIGIFFAGIVSFGTGIFCVALTPVKGFTCMGIGAILVAISILAFWLFAAAVFVWIPKLVRAVVKGVKALFHRNEGGNEI